MKGKLNFALFKFLGEFLPAHGGKAIILCSKMQLLERVF